MNERSESERDHPGLKGAETRPTETYVIRGGVAGRERLRLLSEVMGPSTGALLNEVGVTAGSKCLDIGCGGGDVTFELARAAGPTGLAVGVDFDETKLDIARREASQRGLSNIVFESRDVTQWKPDQLFDLVYARFLLTHLTDPQALVCVMGDQTRVGGVAVVEDIDFRGHFSEPECPALQRYVQWYTSSVQRRGADANIGPRLPGLLREAGFQDVQMRLVHPAALVGGIKLLTCVTLENISEAVLRDGLATAEELQESLDELYAFARDPHTLLGGPRVFQAWGRKGEPRA